MDMSKRLVALLAAALTAMALIPAAASGAQPPWAGPKGDATIADIVIDLADGENDGEFDVLLAAVLNANPAVLAAVAGDDSITVFAPTDQAFVNTFGFADEAAAVAFVSANDVTSVLLYHVAEGRRNSNSVTRAKMIEMFDGNYISARGGSITTNTQEGIGFVATNVKASNGLVHIVDTVLLP
jgi:uncharacterized surface protein with fasciclin (FAS1) repeats